MPDFILSAILFFLVLLIFHIGNKKRWRAMSEFKNLKIPETSKSMKEIQLYYCNAKWCLNECTECLFEPKNIEPFKEWYRFKKEDKICLSDTELKLSIDVLNIHLKRLEGDVNSSSRNVNTGEAKEIIKELSILISRFNKTLKERQSTQ